MTTPPMPSTGLTREAGQSLPVACGNFLFRYRNAIFPVVLLALAASFPPVYPRGSARLDSWMDLLGFAVAVAGQGLRAGVIGYTYVSRGGKHGRVHAKRLVTEGFFRHSRNPLYLGNLLILLGLFIILNNPWVYLLGGAFFLFAYRAIVAAEEVYLRGKFGIQYDQYCRDVRRWLPDFRGLRRSIEGFRFDWRRLVIKEYGSTYAWIATVLALLAYESIVNADWTLRYLGVLSILLVGASAGWATARYLKKGAPGWA